MYLLHRYNPEGVEYIYRAIENNMSYTEEGLDTIGSFCCMTGMQKELDTYREKAAVLTQKQIDEFDEIGTLSRKDNLSSEKLPEGMLEKILSFILSNDEGEIDKIYLVRKTVNENFFASVFVIRFSDSADDEKCYNIFHKIFSYLDTFDERQFALFEYWDVKNVKVEKIEGSCVYSKSEQVK